MRLVARRRELIAREGRRSSTVVPDSVTESSLSTLLARLQRGEIDVASAMAQLANSVLPATGHTSAAEVDLDRVRRCGYPEVVFAPGKATAAIADVFRMQLAHGQRCLATRVLPEQARELMTIFPAADHNAMARTLRLDPHNLHRGASGNAEGSGKIVVITAGTGDLPVAEEAAETARWMGCQVDLIVDV